MKRLILVLSCSQMWAQSLQILPSPPAGKAEGSLQIMIVCPPEKQVAGLQWRLSLSGGTTSVSQITAGTAGQEAGKFMTCAEAKDNDPASNLHMCVLTGGIKSIGDGPIAVVRLVARKDSTAITVKVTNALGATADGKPVRFPDTQATVPAPSGAEK